jgi:phosphate transport system permease protein
MIVAIAAGSGPAFTFNPFKGAETMTGYNRPHQWW